MPQQTEPIETEEQAAERLYEELKATPIGFAQLVLGMEGLYWWQDRAISFLKKATGRNKMAVVAPNGSGKSAKVVALSVLYVLSAFPQARVVITSKDGRQLDGQLWRALLDFKPQFPDWHWTERSIKTPGPSGTLDDGGFALGFTTDDAGRAEGWHKINELIAEGETGSYSPGPLLIICDEAKSIPEGIFQGIDRCSYTWLLYVSSPGFDQGRFYDACTNPDFGFDVVQVGLSDCPHIDRAKIEDTIKQYGADDPFTQSTLHGKFMPLDSTGEFVVSRTLYDQTVETPPSFSPGGQTAFCDFGQGSAENVIAHKKGNRVMPLICWRDSNSMSAVGRFIKEFVKLGLRPSEIYGDDGSPTFIDRLYEMNWPINRVNNGAAPRNPDKYENLGAEMWHEGAKLIEGGDVILPDDPILRAQVTTRKTKFLSDGRFGVESKKDMKARNIASPDRGDAVLGVLSAETTLATIFFDEVGLRKLEREAQIARPEHGSLDVAGDGLAYNSVPANPWITVWERPITGLEYLGVLNPPRREEPNADHVFFIIRDAYQKEDGSTEPIRLVCRLRLPCRIDCNPLAEFVHRIVKWYGLPLVIPIVNDRGDIVAALRKKAITLSCRQEYEMQRRGKAAKTFEYGWESTAYTRSLWISELAEAIRENLLKIEDVKTVMELFQLNGDNAQIMREAEALGVALKNITYASKNLPSKKTLLNPHDAPPPGWNTGRRVRTASQNQIS